jgi:hypothetical protein
MNLAGDLLRAVTCTCPVWPTKALFGAVAPERHIGARVRVGGSRGLPPASRLQHVSGPSSVVQVRPLKGLHHCVQAAYA